MQKRDLEDLTLDLEELLLILKEVETRKELIPVAQRHISRLMKKLEAIKENLVAISPQTVEEPAVPSPATVLGEQLRPVTELSKGLTLNDTFRFSRELFNGDKDEMNRVLQEISKMNALADVIPYLSSQIKWDEENDTVKDFVELLKKYFV